MDSVITMSLLTLLKHCRRPLHYKTKINQLRNHEILSLGAIRQSNNRGGFEYGQAYIQKCTKGRYEFVGVWTLSSKPTRQSCWVQGAFTLDEDKLVFEVGIDETLLRAFFKICRYLGVYKREEVCRGVTNWFNKHHFNPLFCGEVISHGRGRQSDRFTLDIRDRIAADPLLVFMDKYQEAI
ncbi:hypothetical protein [Vibrio mediterranei]|uniref:Uncharacterized protein n=1 Tax=Vibrio mediterranei TaxID=689 RepID=A0ABX5D4D1_9VIBR|nr:hypothetical protein [Vibrio mediterranei]PCD85328.1 hypothetical protein COR52_27260 [Vibrio mediterranei]PRQ64525.1 hypothetical protein COR51_27100 [Vibrio mediterranei]